MKFIDIRSDTVTIPTIAMKKVFLESDYGDVTKGDDPVLPLLEKEVADILGKEAASFVPTGTFGNQCAIMTHTNPG